MELKRLINKYCVNVTEMSKKIDINRQAVMRHIKGGNMTIDSAKKYSKFFGISLDDFLK